MNEAERGRWNAAMTEIGQLKEQPRHFEAQRLHRSRVCAENIDRRRDAERERDKLRAKNAALRAAVRETAAVVKTLQQERDKARKALGETARLLRDLLEAAEDDCLLDFTSDAKRGIRPVKVVAQNELRALVARAEAAAKEQGDE